MENNPIRRGYIPKKPTEDENNYASNTSANAQNYGSNSGLVRQKSRESTGSNSGKRARKTVEVINQGSAERYSHSRSKG